MNNIAEENYIKAIFQLGEQGSQSVSTNSLSDYLQNKPSSVTDMLQKLGDKELVHYTKYKGALLSPKGRKQALAVLRKHRLWETFLVNHLGFSWSEVHDTAEQLEHIQSPKLIERLDQFLGFPTTDPHGDPIPSPNGKIARNQQVSLAQSPINEPLAVTGVKDSSSVFLEYLDELFISLGTTITLLKVQDFDSSIVVSYADKTVTLSEKVANNIFVQQIEK